MKPKGRPNNSNSYEENQNESNMGIIQIENPQKSNEESMEESIEESIEESMETDNECNKLRRIRRENRSESTVARFEQMEEREELNIEPEKVQKTNSLMERCRGYDFVLCVGNYFDSDRDLFIALNEKYKFRSNSSSLLNERALKQEQKEPEEFEPNEKYFYTVSVGKKKSMANVSLENTEEVEELLRFLTGNNSNK